MNANHRQLSAGLQWFRRRLPFCGTNFFSCDDFCKIFLPTTPATQVLLISEINPRSER